MPFIQVPLNSVDAGYCLVWMLLNITVGMFVLKDFGYF